tara:strand:- start:540 stop:3284 length:2745 start_codon:yes stop_codon:yes gene_type:complete
LFEFKSLPKEYNIKTAEDHLREFFQVYSDQEYSVAELRKIFGVSQKEKSHLKQALQELVRTGDVQWLTTNKKYTWANDETGQAAGQYVKPEAAESDKDSNFYAKYQAEKIQKAEAEAKAEEEAEKYQKDVDQDTVANELSKPAKAPKPITQLRGRIIQHEKMWKIQQTSVTDQLFMLPQDIAPFKENDRVIFKMISDDRAEIVAGIDTEVSFDDVKARFLNDNKLKPYFSKHIKEQVAAVSPDIVVTEGRKDFRELHTVCIDPFGARDHDDAISLEKKGTGFELGIHIADVSHYVKEETPIDEEAAYRAFTQYLPWAAVHMLPEELSSDMCSLKVGQERYAFSCMVELSSSGIIKGYEFMKSVVKVDEFHTYEEAMAIAEAHPRHALSKLRKVTRLLNERRKKHGVLLLDMPETKVKFDELNEPMGLEVKHHIESMNWIEECMLTANQCCAQFLKANEVPGVFREHGYPEEDDVLELATAEPDLFKGAAPVASYFAKKSNPESNLHEGVFELFQILVNNARGDLNKTRRVLRTMQKANYRTDGKGHFALCWQDYAHFTSPIRRYADLLVHRQMSARLAKVQLPHSTEAAESIAGKISDREIVVMKIERRAVKFCGAWMAQDYLGEELDGKVSGMQEFGLFVEIPGMGFEGLVRYNSMPGDFYVYNEEQGFVYGRRSNRRIYTGNDIRIKVSKVNVLKGEVDFDCVSLSGEVLTDNKPNRAKPREGDRGRSRDESRSKPPYGRGKSTDADRKPREFIRDKSRDNGRDKPLSEGRSGSGLYGSGGGRDANRERKTFSGDKPRENEQSRKRNDEFRERDNAFAKDRSERREDRAYGNKNDYTSRDKNPRRPGSTRSADTAINIVMNEDSHVSSKPQKSAQTFDETGVKVSGWEKIKQMKESKTSKSFDKKSKNDSED